MGYVKVPTWMTHWDQNNKDGGSINKKSENGFIFWAVYKYFAFYEDHKLPSAVTCSKSRIASGGSPLVT